MAATGADCVAAGWASHLAPAERLSQLEDRLVALGAQSRQPAAVERAIQSVQVTLC